MGLPSSHETLNQCNFIAREMTKNRICPNIVTLEFEDLQYVFLAFEHNQTAVKHYLSFFA